jgi:glycosyltransferase involved in cell wall biosynthesis
MFAGDHDRAQRYLWLQDISSRFIDQYTPTFCASLHGVFVLSNFHAQHGLPAHAASITTITPNGLDAGYFVGNGTTNLNHRFMYASSPNRGLYEVLQAWPRIRQHVPNATLTVYYGFSDSFMKYGQSTMPNFQEWYHTMLELLKQPGVQYVGMVDHLTLAHAYATHGFYLYPTSFPETGCVALMKALAMGAIPITSRYVNSTLPELTKQWDLGPEGHKDGTTIATNKVWFDQWVGSVVRAATQDPVALAEHRQGMVKESRPRFLWRTVASTWHGVFEQDRMKWAKKGTTGKKKKTLRELFGAVLFGEKK